jgi:hypothetical protein
MESTLDYLEKLTTESKKSETEILALAFQTGLRQLWREHVLGRYLKQEISRAELAERQHQAMLEDTVWGLAD